MNNSEPFGLKKIYAKMPSNTEEDLVFRNHSLLELANLYYEKCDFPNAIECLEKVKTEALQFHLYDNYFRAVALLLRIFSERLEFNKVQSIVREVVQVGETIPDYAKYVSKLQYNQGIFNVYAKDFDAAWEHFELAEQAAKLRLDDSTVVDRERAEAARDLVSAQFGMASVASSKGRFGEALERLESVEKRVRDFSDLPQDVLKPEYLEASIFVSRGNIYRELGEYQKALDTFWRAHGQLKSQKIWSYYYYVLLGLGRIYLAMDDTSRATIFFDLIADALANLELNALREILDREHMKMKNSGSRLVVDRERKVVVEQEKGEIHFERRFILLEILYLLASEPGKIFTKELLVDRIWKESYNPMIHDSKVYTSISRLRKLIEPDFKRPRYILNERDGYSFNPAVQIEELGNWRRDIAAAEKSLMGEVRL